MAKRVVPVRCRRGPLLFLNPSTYALMCCFSQPVERVSDTHIFARPGNGQQFLVYSMAYAATSPLAMVLPLPVPANPPEDAVRFINLEGYVTFFDDMRRGFPLKLHYPRSPVGRAIAVDAPRLKVHDVGRYEASFVPRLDDFDRLDERFRIPADVWQHLPDYQDFGFAVFKLKETRARGRSGLVGRLLPRTLKTLRVHPMAFTFPRRNPDLLYFPTVHIHDRQVHPYATFDHMLYCQPDAGLLGYLQGWEESFGPASRFMRIEQTEGIVEPTAPCWRRPLVGRLENKDALVGEQGTMPAFSAV